MPFVSPQMEMVSKPLAGCFRVGNVNTIVNKTVVFGCLSVLCAVYEVAASSADFSRLSPELFSNASASFLYERRFVIESRSHRVERTESAPSP